MKPLSIDIVQLDHGKHLPLPSYGTHLSAGLDLYCALTEPVSLHPMERRLIPTGIALAIPQGYEAQIRPRSGLALKHGLTVLNTPGTIDADYRGEIFVIMVNLSNEIFTFEPGMRFAQLVIAPYTRIEWDLCETLDHSERGQGAFGSTGI